MDYTNDFILLKKISQKDTIALRKFYEMHSKYLYSVIFYILKDEEEAEDLLQEVIIQVWEKSDLYNEKLGSPLAWVTSITRNKSIDRLRSKSFKKRSDEIDIEKYAHIPEDSVSLNPENHFSSNEEQQEINNAMKLLNENQRTLIEFAYFRGYSQIELSDHFNIPLGTVKTRLRAAIMLMRNKMQDFEY